jgi:tetratricopeptide (TPR) repeat protein
MSETPRSLADLFTRYLQQQMAAQTDGLGFADPDGQVVPHEAVPVQPVEPRLAWQDALAALSHLAPGRSASIRDVPPDWPVLVANHEPAVALAFCAGNFPQLVRNLQPLLGNADLTVLRPSAGRPLSVPSPLLEWATGTRAYPQILLAAGVLRLCRRFDEAAELLHLPGNVPAAWRAAKANEEAALAWHRGRAEEALDLWCKQESSVPVLFNRGMAALFLGRPDEAHAALTEAVAPLPDTDAWHHLGHLYLALADARR